MLEGNLIAFNQFLSPGTSASNNFKLVAKITHDISSCERGWAVYETVHSVNSDIFRGSGS
jgi:hypothetical protein